MSCTVATRTRACKRCGGLIKPTGQSGRPRTSHSICPAPDVAVIGTDVLPMPPPTIADRPPVPPEPVATPFNSTPHTAPLPPAEPWKPPPGVVTSWEPPQPDPPFELPAPAPGLLQTSITAELAAMRSVSPMAETLKAAAIQVAIAADAIPAADLKNKLTAIKELRSIIEQLTKSAGGVEDDYADTPVGSSKPEVVHAP
jgi:hypothetical protein